MRELTAKLQGVLAPQIRDTVLQIPVGVGAVSVGAVIGVAQAATKTHADLRQPAPFGHAGVEGVGRATTTRSGA